MTRPVYTAKLGPTVWGVWRAGGEGQLVDARLGSIVLCDYGDTYRAVDGLVVNEYPTLQGALGYFRRMYGKGARWNAS